jgi:hypothetical protein
MGLRQDFKIGGVTAREEERRGRAIQYLEKIFQIAFWLNPLSSNPTDGGTFAKYVRSLAISKTERPLDKKTPADTGASGRTQQVKDPSYSAPSGEATNGAPFGSPSHEKPSVPQQTKPEALATIQLDSTEIDFVASPEIAAIASSSPRAVKRLVNVYRLVRARIGETGGTPVAINGSVPDYPLIALCLAVETGQPVTVADAFYDGLKDLHAKDQIDPVVSRSSASALDQGRSRFREALSGCDALDAALQKVAKIRGGTLLAGDVVRVARIARHYSFNRFR